MPPVDYISFADAAFHAWQGNVVAYVNANVAAQAAQAGGTLAGPPPGTTTRRDKTPDYRSCVGTYQAPLRHPFMSKSRRILLLAFVCVALPLPIALMMAHIGLWTGVAVMVVVCIGTVRHFSRQHEAIRRERRLRLGLRPAIPIEQQADSLIQRGVLPARFRHRVLDEWRLIAEILHVDPAHMRWSDTLHSEYGNEAASQEFSDLDDLFDHLAEWCEPNVAWKHPDAALPGRETCGHCQYDVSGTPQASRCPECGRVTLRFGTLADALELRAGVYPGVMKDRSDVDEARDASQVPPMTTVYGPTFVTPMRSPPQRAAGHCISTVCAVLPCACVSQMEGEKPPLPLHPLL